MKQAIVIAILFVATTMMMAFVFTSCEKEEPSEQTEQTQEQGNQSQFHPMFIPNPNGGVQMIPMWY